MTATWAPSAEPALKNVSLEFSLGQKVAIIGRVGCGKTSLLSTILEETLIFRGHIEKNSNLIAIAE